jgi:uncharacterized heparinase superfamily protein
VFFSGPEAQRWCDDGLSILAKELDAQILADGGHFELSPMYHAIVMEDVLDLINLSRAFSGTVPVAHVAQWRRTVEAMRRWMVAMIHPDGEIAFFNDAAFGIAPQRSSLEDYAERLDFPRLGEVIDAMTRLDASGYARIAKDGATTFLDIAPIGPDHLPGHAHADTLSFEFSLQNKRIVVNCGTSCYGTGRQRQAERATTAHSTVEVDGKNSSEVWAGFRVGRRARVTAREMRAHPIITVKGCHDGYARLRGHPWHCREWSFPDRRLKIIDTVIGGAGRAVARFHLAPDVVAHMEKTSCGTGAFGTLRVAGLTVTWRTSSPATIEPSAWHPEFGRQMPTRCITVPFTGDRLATEFAW